MKYFFILLPFFAFSQTISLTDSDVKAFYTAVGHGKAATGGREGDVYFVSNLNASGPGSLQYGLDTAPAAGRTIIFRVSGWINHGGTDFLSAAEPNITIAGQTAPGGGIGIRGEFRIQDDNIIARHLSVRNDDGFGVNAQSAVRIVAFSGLDTEDVVLDHLSIGWASDENLTITSADANGFINRVTVQNCLIDNNLDSGYNAINFLNVTNSTYYQNVLAYSTERNILSSTCGPGSFEFINNMVYDFTSGMNVAWGSDFDVIGNHFDAGDNTVPDFADFIINLRAPLAGGCADLGKVDPGVTGTDLYYNDNIATGFTDQYNANAISRLQPAAVASSGITPYAASSVRANAFANSGAYNGLDQGLNAYDADILDKVLSSAAGARLTSRTWPGSFPALASGTPYVDSDGDGLSDEYEVANGAGPGNWFVSPSTRPVTAQLVSGVTIDQTGVTAAIRYTHMDIFLGELAGDWTGGSPDGGGTNDPATDKGRSGTSAMLIAH